LSVFLNRISLGLSLKSYVNMKLAYGAAPFDTAWIAVAVSREGEDRT
jgi:hypothetical protein